MSRHDMQWTPCQEGEIQHLIGRLRHRRRWRTYGRGAAVAALMLLAASGYWAAVAGRTAGLRSLSCRQVIALAPDFFAGRLDDGTAAAIRHHLAGCRSCREHLADMQRHPSHAAIIQPAADHRAAIPAPTATVAHLVAAHSY